MSVVDDNDGRRQRCQVCYINSSVGLDWYGARLDSSDCVLNLGAGVGVPVVLAIDSKGDLVGPLDGSLVALVCEKKGKNQLKVGLDADFVGIGVGDSVGLAVETTKEASTAVLSGSDRGVSVSLEREKDELLIGLDADFVGLEVGNPLRKDPW
mmetsp:Transcript_12077/g.29493  ORF Transcript_12077/g.29493 Transcript_12077/m.29493 type:complete len:153 (-) Transcript_12077:1410-1868(-)